MVVAEWGLGYNGDGELVALLLQRNGLLPLIERPGQQDLVSPVVPGKLGEDIRFLESGLLIVLGVDLTG